ncbi:MAG TPA: DMT family protein [Candidatus Methylacidiphilales bacterium]
MLTVIKTALLLFISNAFMTFAWYGHLKYFHSWRLWIVILISWGIAFFEYCFQVPANRLGATVFTGYQLKILQEIITLLVFAVFAKLVLGESMRWNHMVSFAFLAGAAWFAFAYKGT